jgi:uncharacterized protein (DUF885 family)
MTRISTSCITRRNALALGLGLAGAGALNWAHAAGSASEPGAGPAPGGFDAWSERFAADWVRLSAEQASYTQYFDGPEQAALERELTPHTEAQRERRYAQARLGLAQLAGFEGSPLTPVQRTEAALLRWSLQTTLAEAPFEYHGFVFNQLFGLQVSLVNFMSQAHPMRDADDLQAYLARLAQVSARMDEGIAQTRVSAARGLLPPRFILERGRTQLQDFLQPPAAQNLFVTTLARRSEKLPGVSEAQRSQALAVATAMVEERIRPAWQRVLALLDELHPRTTHDAGLWRLPDGAAAYAQALATYTTTRLSAEEIHALGLREVARIESEMDGVLKGMGRSQGSVEARMSTLRAEQNPPAEPDPRPALLARYAAAVKDNLQRSQAVFNLQPKAPVEVRREPALTERTAPAHYSTPAPDGSRPGVMWVPLPGPDYNVPALRSLAVHEAIPGHHFQLAIQQEQTDLPRWRQRRVFGGGSAHSEGWALYAERLAIDQGWYEGDPTQLLGALDSQLFRARRLVVDTGLHAKRWTREQAIAYGIGAQEVERYVANPGQACAYMIGMLRMLALRDEAQKAMGARYSLKGFHDVVLKTGSVPLDVLGDVVHGWAAQA